MIIRNLFEILIGMFENVYGGKFGDKDGVVEGYLVIENGQFDMLEYYRFIYF